MTDLAGLNIKYLPGVGPKRAELLNKELEIFTYLDLLHYYPYKYIDRSKTYKINEIDGSMPYIQLRGKIVSYTTHGEGARRRLTALFSDGSKEYAISPTVTNRERNIRFSGNPLFSTGNSTLPTPSSTR